MALSVVAAASSKWVSGTTMTVTKPAGTADLDVIVAICSTDWNTYASITAPSGNWALIDGRDGGANVMHSKVFVFTAGPSEPATYTFGCPNDGDQVVTLISLRGATAAGVVSGGVTFNASTAVTRTAPSVATVVGGILICFATADGDGGTNSRTWTPPSGMTEQGDIQSTAFFTNQGVATLLNPPNPSGTRDFTANQTLPAQAGCVGSIAIAPSAPLSARFDASTDRVVATTALPASTVSTMCAWVRIATDRNAFSAPWGMGVLTPAVQHCNNPTTDADGTSMRAWNADSSGSIGPLNMTAGVWHRLAVVYSGTQATLYLGDATPANALGSVGPTTQSTSLTPTTLWVGSNLFGEWWNGDVAGLKVWNAALSASEVAAEFYQYDAVRTANLVRAVRFDGDLSETGGAAAMTAGGTAVAYGAGPGVPLVATAAAIPEMVKNSSAMAAMRGY